ncbi:MAG: hypothetical protein JWM16_5992 [Verrucomicrobiales bacterium]|nr:hypothetical protein [Verrucomicrobiales bacterium]
MFIASTQRSHAARNLGAWSDSLSVTRSKRAFIHKSAGQSPLEEHWINSRMKNVFAGAGLLITGVGIGFGLAMIFHPVKSFLPRSLAGTATSPSKSVAITISAIIDGSERFIFTPDNVWDEHGRWQPPKDVLFNGEPWTDLTTPPPQWDKLSRNLDLSRAELVQRKGRDIIALERTADGFDLYFADTQMGAAQYEATISIPIKP